MARVRGRVRYARACILDTCTHAYAGRVQTIDKRDLQKTRQRGKKGTVRYRTLTTKAPSILR